MLGRHYYKCFYVVYVVCTYTVDCLFIYFIIIIVIICSVIFAGMAVRSNTRPKVNVFLENLSSRNLTRAPT